MSAQVESAVLTGSSSINLTGNALANTLVGNAGDNVLDGGAGVDTMTGGLGNDTYVVDSTQDVIVELAGGGNDTVRTDLSYVLAAELENVTLTGTGSVDATGNGGANRLVGNAGNNVLSGGAGADTLDGAAGADTLIGGTGDDTYVVADAADAVVETAGEGTDTVQSSIAWSLAANLENLVLTGGAAVSATGNAAANAITGNAAANRIDGAGGADTMAGGAGDDTYVVDNVGDVVTEAAGEGNDTVEASLTWSLGSQLEALTLTGSAAINATGNALANTLRGNSGDNVLDGGAGADTMIGGLGNDFYVVDDSGDVIVEAAGEGSDTVQSSVSYTLGANLENIALSGTAAANLTGNALANVLTGNVADNVIDGGAGADTMIGGQGNDTYLVDNVGDVVVELAGQGIDAVQAGVSYRIGANVENLTLTGSGAINGTGNTSANSIVGNAGDNVLDGGAGDDTMTGGAGNDTYLVDSVNDVVVEVAGGGTDLVQSTISYTLGANVEKLALLGGNPTSGTGNALANVITGNGAGNRIDGGLGADTMIGGAGDDTYVVDNVGDVLTELAGGGTDTVETSLASYSLGAQLDNLTGSGIDNTLRGNDLANLITGLGGNDTLGGSGASSHSITGIDTLVGGLGDDTYVIDYGLATDPFYAAPVVVVEQANEGTDKVIIDGKAVYSYTLSANVEQLFATTVRSGYIGSVNGVDTYFYRTLIGNELDNLIDFDASASFGGRLDGGLGADTLRGSEGADIYVVDNVGDVVDERGGSVFTTPRDRVETSIDYTLGNFLEDLTLTGSTAITGTGNQLGNVLDGSTSSAGNVLRGGLGNDTYTVGIGDAVIENPGEGNDSVVFNYQSASGIYSVADWGLANVENFSIAASFGAGLTLIGSDQNEHLTYSTYDPSLFIGSGGTLYGGAGNDTLTGYSGSDTLVGGAGDDVLDGSAGVNVYVFGRGDGHDTIVNPQFNASGSTLQLSAGIAQGDLVLTRLGNDLLVAIRGSSDTILLQNHFTGGNFRPHVTTFSFADLSSWDATAILGHVITDAAPTLAAALADAT